MKVHTHTCKAGCCLVGLQTTSTHFNFFRRRVLLVGWKKGVCLWWWWWKTFLSDLVSAAVNLYLADFSSSDVFRFRPFLIEHACWRRRRLRCSIAVCRVGGRAWANRYYYISNSNAARYGYISTYVRTCDRSVELGNHKSLFLDKFSPDECLWARKFVGRFDQSIFCFLSLSPSPWEMFAAENEKRENWKSNRTRAQRKNQSKAKNTQTYIHTDRFEPLKSGSNSALSICKVTQLIWTRSSPND